VIRKYTKADLDRTSIVWLRSGQAEYQYLVQFQKLNQSSAKDVFRRLIQDKCKIWVFELNDDVIGFMALDRNYIDRLYIDPENQGQGIGSRLIEYAKEMYPDGLVLNTHLQNTRARLFYEARGFKVVSYGLSPPPESMPDVKYRWSQGQNT